MEIFPVEVRNYRTPGGKEPFRDWLIHLRDARAQVRILKRLKQVRLGTFGQYGAVGAGVLELKVDEGPGYRIYAGLDGPVLLVLLCGGEKHGQGRDIQKAKGFWADYKSRKGKEHGA